MNDGIKVWDIAIRVFHWSLVLCFTIAYITGEEAETLHAYAGYIIIGLLVFRLVWGFIGTRTARFASFIYSPAETIRYASAFVTRNPIHYIGHNPLAALMVFALLLSIALSCWTGLLAYAEKGKGPLAQGSGSVVSMVYANGKDDNEHRKSEHEGGEEFWEEVHEAAVNFTLLLVLLHIAGVLLASVVHGENLIRAMFTGRTEKTTDTVND